MYIIFWNFDFLNSTPCKWSWIKCYCYWIFKLEQRWKLSYRNSNRFGKTMKPGLVKEKRLWFCVYDFVLHHSSNNFQPLEKFEEFSKPDELADTVGYWKRQCSLVRLVLFTLLSSCTMWLHEFTWFEFVGKLIFLQICFFTTDCVVHS